MSEVVHLIDREPGFSPDGHDGLFEWLDEWVAALKQGEYGPIRSLALVIESKDGRLATLSQSLGAMDGARLIGLLHMAAHRKADGHANIEGLRE